MCLFWKSALMCKSNKYLVVELMDKDIVDRINDRIFDLKISEQKAMLNHAHDLASDIIETYDLINNLRKKCFNNYAKMIKIMDDVNADIDFGYEKQQEILFDELDAINGELNIVELADDKILRMIKALNDDKFHKLLKESLDE